MAGWVVFNQGRGRSFGWVEVKIDASAQEGPAPAGVHVPEAWRLLPEAMKAKANEAFGEEALYVRKEDFRLWFGQRKANRRDFIDTVQKWES